MNEDGQIYFGQPDEIPKDDKLRLEEAQRAEVERLTALVEELRPGAATHAERVANERLVQERYAEIRQRIEEASDGGPTSGPGLPD